MKVSIDSVEPLEDVVRVIGALYEVTLTVARSNEAVPTVRAPIAEGGDGAQAAASKASTRTGGRVRSKKRLGRVSAAELRAWAHENGHTVHDRGPIPAAVSSAYHQAQHG